MGFQGDGGNVGDRSSDLPHQILVLDVQDLGIIESSRLKHLPMRDRGEDYLDDRHNKGRSLMGQELHLKGG